VSGSGRKNTKDPRKVALNREHQVSPNPEVNIMVNNKRPDDSIESSEPDVEGHRVLRADSDDETDVEGHRVLRADSDDETDVEGHRVLRNLPADDGDDTEGHRVLR
jgi:hypothetical protein